MIVNILFYIFYILFPLMLISFAIIKIVKKKNKKISLNKVENILVNDISQIDKIPDLLKKNPREGWAQVNLVKRVVNEHYPRFIFFLSVLDSVEGSLSSEGEQTFSPELMKQFSKLIKDAFSSFLFDDAKDFYISLSELVRFSILQKEYKKPNILNENSLNSIEPALLSLKRFIELFLDPNNSIETQMIIARWRSIEFNQQYPSLVCFSFNYLIKRANSMGTTSNYDLDKKECNDVRKDIVDLSKDIYSGIETLDYEKVCSIIQSDYTRVFKS